jgi:hypothetical protein
MRLWRTLAAVGIMEEQPAGPWPQEQTKRNARTRSFRPLTPLSPRDKCDVEGDDPVRPKPLEIRGACGLQIEWSILTRGGAG